MKSVLVVLLALSLCSSVVFAGPIIPNPPAAPGEPVLEYVLSASIDPAEVLVTTYPVTFSASYTYDGEPVSTAVCNVTVDGSTHNMTLTSEQYVWVSTHGFIIPDVEVSYVVSCSVPSEPGSLKTTDTQYFTPLLDPSLSLVASANPSPADIGDSVTLRAHFTRDESEVTGATCSYAVGSSLNGALGYNSSTSRYEAVIETDTLPAGSRNFNVNCEYPQTGFAVQDSSSFILIDPDNPYLLLASHQPSQVLVTTHPVSFIANYTNASTLVDNAVCNVTINGATHSMALSDDQYVWNTPSGQGFINVDVPVLYNVSCSVPGNGASLRSASGSFTPATDPSLSLLTGVSPTPAYNDTDVTFWANYSRQGAVLSAAQCNFTMNSLIHPMSYNGSSQRHEYVVVAEQLPPVGQNNFSVSCTYPPTSYVSSYQQSFYLYDRETSDVLAIWHTPQSPSTTSTIYVFANYTTPSGAPVLDQNCTMKFMTREAVDMTFNATGDNTHRVRVTSPPSGQNRVYNVSCGDLSLTGMMTITRPSTNGGGGPSSGGFIPPPPPPCVPDWSCGDWDDCSIGIQMRECNDINTCGNDSSRPATVRSCEDLVDGEPGVDDGSDASLIKPQFVRQPLIVTPGEPVEVVLFNDGLELFNDLTVYVGETSVLFTDSLHPGDRKSVFVSLPLNIVLVQEEILVRLLYNDVELDKGKLSFDVQWPLYGAYLDAHAEPKLYIVVDNTEHLVDRSGIEVLVKLYHEGQEIFMDYLGPYGVGASSRLVRSVPVPAHYLREGDIELRATFYEQGAVVAETAGFFRSSVSGGFNPLPLLVIVLVGLGVVVLFFAFDMVYNKRGLSEEFKSLGKRK